MGDKARGTFGTRFGVVMTMIGVAVGLGNVWRFPYMVGEFGGAAFVAFYLAVVAIIGIPALVAELALGRHTRRGTVGAFALGGLPLGRQVGWFFFAVVTAATAYYSAVIGWVLYHAAAMLVPFDAGAVLPPATGFTPRPYLLQAAGTGLVLLACAAVLLKGLRGGIERASKLLTPALFVILLVLIARSVTLPGAGEGIRWYVLKFEISHLTAANALAAIGQAVFSLALGGTFMVVYGSYLDRDQDLRWTAAATAAGDTTAGLLAGLAIFPAVFALGLAPDSGPALIFVTLPTVFRAMPGGSVFGFLFFAGLAGVAYLSAVAALEVLTAGLTDNTSITRTRAVRLMTAIVFVVSLPPTVNMRIFAPWDLTFGSGMQTLGAFCAAVTVGWAFVRADAIRELGSRRLYLWVRYVIPGILLAVGVWWATTAIA
ncbi:MAG TPA: sodium-dependent transporter [Gemmatimonadales bacterium]